MSSSKTIAIMQPTYLPWLGYFDLMDRVDEFVLLDCVQFERNSWQHRNRVKGAQGEIMLSIPVRRTGLATRLDAAEIADPDFARRHLRTIEQAYARSNHLEASHGALVDLYTRVPRRLLAHSRAWIEWLRDRLGVRTPIVLASTLAVDGAKDALVRAICEARGATAYLATPGSRVYMDGGTAFADGRIAVRYQAYDPEPYGQPHGAFVPYLSALDAVLNCGAKVREILLAGRRPAVA